MLLEKKDVPSIPSIETCVTMAALPKKIQIWGEGKELRVLKMDGLPAQKEKIQTLHSDSDVLSEPSLLKCVKQ